MNSDARSSSQNIPSERIKEFAVQAGHDICNPLANILGFCEILLAQVEAPGAEYLKVGLKAVERTVTQMNADLKQVLNPDRTPPASAQEVKALQVRLQPQAAQILRTTQLLLPKAGSVKDGIFREDLSRMCDSAQRAGHLIDTRLSLYPSRP